MYLLSFVIYANSEYESDKPTHIWPKDSIKNKSPQLTGRLFNFSNTDKIGAARARDEFGEIATWLIGSKRAIG